MEARPAPSQVRGLGLRVEGLGQLLPRCAGRPGEREVAGKMHAGELGGRQRVRQPASCQAAGSALPCHRTVPRPVRVRVGV